MNGASSPAQLAEVGEGSKVDSWKFPLPVLSGIYSWSLKSHLLKPLGQPGLDGLSTTGLLTQTGGAQGWFLTLLLRPQSSGRTRLGLVSRALKTGVMKIFHGRKVKLHERGTSSLMCESVFQL